MAVSPQAIAYVQSFIKAAKAENVPIQSPADAIAAMSLHQGVSDERDMELRKQAADQANSILMSEVYIPSFVKAAQDLGLPVTNAVELEAALDIVGQVKLAEATQAAQPGVFSKVAQAMGLRQAASEPATVPTATQTVNASPEVLQAALQSLITRGG